jgi:prepilin-type N-terminal cleavage/methylation domain-containing protein
MPCHIHKRNEAFTLIELLVVIAIIAILAVVVVLTLNPAELLRQSRDSNRLSDLSTLTSAINLYSADQGGASGYSIGSSSVTYLSIPDPTATTTAGTDCSGLGFPSGGAFHCAASSTLRNVNGTGWIPINFSAISSGSPLGSLPIDPVNQSSSNLYYTYQTNGTTFVLRAVPESQKYAAQAGANPTMLTAGSNPLLDGGYWVFVPGNSTFGTNNFYVMKYDAACTNIATGIAQTTPSSGANGYSDSTTNCTPANGLAPAALPNAVPIVSVFQTSAATYCSNIGAHLITNNEWQTIAWNAENVASNWSGGTVGSGYVYSGHNDNVPAQASVASPSDSQGCVGTDGPASCGGTGTNATQIRTLTLSNGSVIWDMAGNVWQWTNNTITGTNEPNNGVAGWSWKEFTAVTTWGTMTQQTAGPANSTWNSTQGIGQLYSEDATDATIYGFLRGGHWYAGGDAGVEALDPVYGPGPTRSYIGFRCAR